MDWVALATMLITAFATTSSIIIAINTLKQNNKMIEESTRPVITIYKEVIHINSPMEYLIVKNFGSSSAKVDDIIFDEEKFKKISKLSSTVKYRNPFPFLIDSQIAPGQSFKIPIKTMDTDIESIEFVLKYSSSIKSYTETALVQLKQDSGIYRLKFHTEANELKTISNTLQELVNRTF